LEPGQQFEQENSGCVGDDLFDILKDRSNNRIGSCPYRPFSNLYM